MVSVLLTDDQHLRRLALRALLTAEPDLTVVGEAAGGAETVRSSAALRPDVVLMTGSPSATDGIDTIRRIARRPRLLHPQGLTDADEQPPRVLVVTTTDRQEYAHAALRAGAAGFLLHDVAPDELTTAVRVVASGDAVITPALTRTLIDTVRSQPAVGLLHQDSDLCALTGRERDVLTAVASGWSNDEIAKWLCIAPTTVKSHVSHVLAKIGARARVQAVTFAYESGLVRPAA